MKLSSFLLMHDEESMDYNSFMLSGDDTPLNRVFLTFMILFVNLMIGCAFTIIFFKVRGYLAIILKVFCCGLCDDCDCEYDGTYPSRLISQRQQRLSHSKRNRNEAVTDPLDAEAFDCNCGEAIFDSIWIIYKRVTFARRGRKFFCLMSGLVLSFLISDRLLTDDVKEPVTVIHSFSHHSVFTQNDPRRVYFTTPTIKSGIQAARLTRIAQALFPHRDFVTWVIISSDPVRNYHWSGTRIEHWSYGVISRWVKNETRVMEHLEDLRERVERFGIPFVILSGHQIHHRNKGFKIDQRIGSKGEVQLMMSTQIGLSWVTKTYNKGVLLLGSEDVAYNSHLFSEVRETKLVSSWPSYSQSKYIIGLYTPVISNKPHEVKGYFEGGEYRARTIPLHGGRYALNISLAKSLKADDKLWKLTLNTLFTRDLKLHTKDIQYFGKNCTEIYSWQLTHSFTNVIGVMQKKLGIKFKHSWAGTNVNKLIEHIRKSFALDLNQY